MPNQEKKNGLRCRFYELERVKENFKLDQWINKIKNVRQNVIAELRRTTPEFL